jgi:Na+/melibiose symporter-like transporter
MLLNGMFFGLFMASVYKEVALNILSDHTLTLAGALGSVCNGSSRIIWATLQDKYGFRRIYFILLCLQLVDSLTIYYVRESDFLYTVWVAIAFACDGGHFSMFPTAAVKLFGI